MPWKGSIFRSADNLIIYATSNRRHLLPEYMTDNEQATFRDGELHQSEAVEEKISLSDRFGLWLSFYPFRQDAYLAWPSIGWTKLAGTSGIDAAWSEEARAEALRWALARGVRSGRTAQHFARHWVGSKALEASAEATEQSSCRGMAATTRIIQQGEMMSHSRKLIAGLLAFAAAFCSLQPLPTCCIWPAAIG